MATLGDGAQITTVEDKEIVLTATNGQQFRMKIADLAEAVRQVMPVATSEKNGLMGYKDKVRYIPLTIINSDARFIRLADLKEQSSFVCLLNFGRVEGAFVTTHCLSAFHNSIGGGNAQINKISGDGVAFTLYKKLSYDKLEIYVDTITVHNYLEGFVLSYTGGTEIIIEKLNQLPDGCVAI